MIAEVWDFSIPTENTMETSFELWFGTVWTYMTHMNAIQNVDYYDLYRDYYWYLADYRLCSGSIPEPYSSADEYAELVEQYLSDPRINIYRIPSSQDNYNPDGTLKDEYKAYIDALDAKGLLEQGFIYTFDEPAQDAVSYTHLDVYKRQELYTRLDVMKTLHNSEFDTVDIVSQQSIDMVCKYIITGLLHKRTFIKNSKSSINAFRLLRCV